MVKINTIVCKQPIGNLYLFTLPASVLKDLVVVKNRSDNKEHVQRKYGKKRIKDITKYSNSLDACFPINALLNINEKDVSVIGNTLDLSLHQQLFEILDGQHRLYGFFQSDIDYEIPLGAFIGLSTTQKARIFKAINANARSVNKSHLIDMTPQTQDSSNGEELGHQICALLNTEDDSPFKGRVKMLGDGKGWFNQASLVTPLKSIIDNGCLKNVSGVDTYIVLLDYIKAWQHTFPEEFVSKDSLLIKGFGVNVMLGCFETLYNMCHQTDGQDFERFVAVLSAFKGVEWTKESMGYNTSDAGRKKRINELLSKL